MLGPQWTELSDAKKRSAIQTIVAQAIDALQLPSFGVTFGPPRRSATGDALFANAPINVKTDGSRPLSDGVIWNAPIEIYDLGPTGDDALKTVLEEVVHRYQQSLVADLYAGRLQDQPERRELAQWLAMSFAGYYSAGSAEGLAYGSQLTERHAKEIAKALADRVRQ